MVIDLKDLSYGKRLERIGLPTQEERWRGDMTMVFQAVRGRDKVDREDLLLGTTE